MFKIVKSLFGGEPAPLPTTPQPQSSLPSGSTDIEFYFRQEVNKSEYLRDDAKQTVLDHLLGKIDILKTANKLSPDEKRTLGINTRLTITRELIGVLNEEGARLVYPSAVVTEMWHRATIKRLRHEQLERLRASTVKKFKFLSSGDGNDCAWCQASQDLEFQVQFDLESALSANCKCDPYCKCSIYPVVEF